MNTFQIALRNTLRNRRRSLMTALAIAVGTFALMLFGAFVVNIQYGMQTEIVRAQGHIHLHKRGFFEYGAGRVTDYDMAGYQQLIQLIDTDPILQQWIAVVTPTLQVAGIAGNYTENSSQGFSGVGLVPEEQIRMRQWDGFQLNTGEAAPYPLAANEMDQGFIGQGLARTLSLCDELQVPSCRDDQGELSSHSIDESILSLAQLEAESRTNSNPNDVSIDLLAASAHGAPNIISLPLAGVEQQSQKARDDRFVALPLALAQRLLYGADEKRISALIIQLRESRLIEPAVVRLQQLIRDHGLDLEVKPLSEFNPFYERVLKMFSSIFGFITLVISLVVLFTIINTMTMSVMERYGEIGTLRSMGLRRSGVRRQFVMEGGILGLLGATLGVGLALVTAFGINQMGVTWTPPSSAGPQPLTLQPLRDPMLILMVWGALVVVPTLASLIPATKATRLSIVDALRHV